MSISEQDKQVVATHALSYVEEDAWVGVGSGTTANAFIDALAASNLSIQGVVAASEASAARLRAKGVVVAELNQVDIIPCYFDGADEIDAQGYCIKGGGGALAREKVIAAASQQFIALAEVKKRVKRLGKQMPIPVEVLPMARSFVARKLVALGGQPLYREGFVTDNGHVILDVHHLPFRAAHELDAALNALPGVVAHGLFVQEKPSQCLYVDHGTVTSVVF